MTARTRLSQLRVAPDVAELALGHARTGLERLYVKADLLAEVRAAMELYAAHVMHVVG